MENQDKKREATLITNPNQDGFSSQIIPVLIIALLIIGSFSLLLTANHHKATPQFVNLTSNSTGASPKTSPSAQSKSTVSTATPLPTATSTPSKTSTIPSPSSTQPIITPATPSSGYTSTTTTITPLAALTTIISKLDVGESEAEVTVQPISIPGPIGTATGHPIVFTLNGKTYYAYTQGKAPDFSLTPAQTSSTMAIVNGSATVSLEPAYLDKLGNLVDVDYQAVGFSTGGN